MSDELVHVPVTQTASLVQSAVPLSLRSTLTDEQLETLQLYVDMVAARAYAQGVQSASPEARELFLQQVAAFGTPHNAMDGSVAVSADVLHRSLSMGSMNAEGGTIQQCICEDGKYNPYCSMHGTMRVQTTRGKLAR